MTRALCLTPAFALLAAPALAGPPVPAHVDPGAKWVLHVDLETMNDSQLGGFVMDMLAKETDDFEDVREIMPNFWPGPKGGMFGLTFFGSALDFDEGEVPEGFVAVLYGNEQIAGWGSMLEAIALHHGIEDQLHKKELHGCDVWSVPMDEGGRIYAALAEGRGDRLAWVIAFDQGHLDHALATLTEGSGGSELLPRDGWREGTIAFLATSAVADIPMDDMHSRVFDGARSVKFRVGESEGDAFLQASLDTGDDQKAQSVLSISQGLMALGNLAAAEDEELAQVMRIAQGVKFSAAGSSVLLDFTRDAGEMVGFLEDLVDDRRELHNHDHDHEGEQPKPAKTKEAW